MRSVSMRCSSEPKRASVFKPDFWPGTSGPYVYLVSWRGKRIGTVLQMQDVSRWFSSEGLVQRARMKLGQKVHKSFEQSYELIKSTVRGTDVMLISSKRGLNRGYVETQLRIAPADTLDTFKRLCKQDNMKEIFSLREPFSTNFATLTHAQKKVWSQSVWEAAREIRGLVGRS